jgi:nicotinate-nucleotide pyrophosphorylase (carboxylating)
MNTLEFVKNVLFEDIGRGDLFSKVGKANESVTGKLIAKSDGVLSGIKYASTLTEIEKFEINWLKNDGDKFEKGETLAVLKGDSHTILRVERTFLNIILHSSSIATLTNQYVSKLEKFPKVTLLDTRKTRPLLREFEKYSTRTGGATNHRMGLDDCLMLKDTHLKTIQDLNLFLKEAKKSIPITSKIEVECETVEFAKEMLQNEYVDIIMCDNMSIKMLEEVTEFKNKYYKSKYLEASGNINLSNISEYASTGIDAISSGSIIHQANWIDLSLKIQ